MQDGVKIQRTRQGTDVCEQRRGYHNAHVNPLGKGSTPKFSFFLAENSTTEFCAPASVSL